MVRTFTWHRVFDAELCLTYKQGSQNQILVLFKETWVIIFKMQSNKIEHYGNQFIVATEIYHFN